MGGCGGPGEREGGSTRAGVGDDSDARQLKEGPTPHKERGSHREVTSIRPPERFGEAKETPTGLNRHLMLSRFCSREQPRGTYEPGSLVATDSAARLTR